MRGRRPVASVQRTSRRSRGPGSGAGFFQFGELLLGVLLADAVEFLELAAEFFGLYALVFVVAWQLAVWVTERYIVEIVRATRGDHRVALGASPRGALALLKLSRAVAALRRREFVLPDDVKAMAVPALAHRIILKPELWASRVSAAQVVQGLLAQVPVPGPTAP